MLLAAIVAPLVLGLGAFLLVPIALLLAPAAVIAGVFAVPALWLSASRAIAARGELRMATPESVPMAAPIAG